MDASDIRVRGRGFVKHPLTVMVVVVLLPTMLGGCGLIGAFYGIFIDPLIPPPTIKAEHDMSGKKVLVWVETTAGVENAILRRTLTQKVQEQLQQHQAVREVIPYERISQFRLSRPDYVQMPVQDLGKHLEAEEVLYVLIDRFEPRYEAAEGFFRLDLTGYVKVVDSADGERVWPVAQTKQPFGRTGQMAQGSGQAFEDKLVRDFCADLAEEISRYFYDYQQPK